MFVPMRWIPSSSGLTAPGGRRCLRFLDIDIRERLFGKCQTRNAPNSAGASPIFQAPKGLVEAANSIEHAPLGHQCASRPDGAAEQDPRRN